MEIMEKLEQLVGQINEVSNDLKEIEEQLDIKEKERLNAIIQIARKGFEWNKIYSRRRVHNCNGCNCSDEYEYFRNENEEIEKGVLLDFDEIKDDTYSGGDRCIQRRELWLLKSGELKVYYFQEDYSNCQGHYWESFREISKNQNLDNFDFDYILQNIIENLENKLERLGNRCETQKRRLEKLNKLVFS